MQSLWKIQGVLFYLVYSDVSAHALRADSSFRFVGARALLIYSHFVGEK